MCLLFFEYLQNKIKLFLFLSSQDQVIMIYKWHVKLTSLRDRGFTYHDISLVSFNILWYFTNFIWYFIKSNFSVSINFLNTTIIICLYYFLIINVPHFYKNKMCDINRDCKISFKYFIRKNAIIKKRTGRLRF